MAKLTASHPLRALKSVLQETMLQWMSASPTARVIDRELGELEGDLLNGAPLMSYLRYNVDLCPESVRSLDGTLAARETVTSLSAMDAPGNMEALHRLGRLAAARDLGTLILARFLTCRGRKRKGPFMRELRRYRRLPEQYVVAIPLRLDTDGFSYRKWGGEQQCKPGDWLVDDDGDIHTVDADVFAATYRQIHRAM